MASYPIILALFSACSDEQLEGQSISQIPGPGTKLAPLNSSGFPGAVLPIPTPGVR